MRNYLKISVAQGLLLLLEPLQEKIRAGVATQQEYDDYNEIKALYLKGVETLKEWRRIEVLLQCSELKEYQIDWSYQAINTDPTRRYFETHLSFHSLKQGLKNIKPTQIQELFDILLKKFKNNKDVPTDTKCEVLNLIEKGQADSNNDYLEYADLIQKTGSSKDYPRFTYVERRKMQILGKIAYLSVINNLYDNFPIDIYGKGLFHEDSRGRISKEDQDWVVSHHLGILKSHMPIPLNDIASSETVFTYLRSADRSHYHLNSKWPRKNFKRLVHPFSNSLSGTILCQVRCLVWAFYKNFPHFKNSSDLSHFLRASISTLLLHTGGHSLNEYTYVLNLKAVLRQLAIKIPGTNQLTLCNLFLNTNRDAFETSLRETILYNQQIIARKRLHKELISYASSKRSILQNHPISEEEIHANGIDTLSLSECTTVRA